MFTAKMLYCLWCSLPEEGDNFVLQPTMPLESTLVEDPIAFIRNYILDKTNEEIAQVKESLIFSILKRDSKTYLPKTEFVVFVILRTRK